MINIYTTYTNIKLPYADKELEIQINQNNISEILTPREVDNLPDPISEIKRALRNPIGCNDLSSLVSSQSRVALICDDNTRLTPAHIIVPEILELLYDGGVKRENIKIIMACGTHRPMTEMELISKLGKKIVQEMSVINYDYRDPEMMIKLEDTKNGTPITINKHVVESDIVIGIGSIVPHHVPGFSGGAKIVQPGVCGGDTTGITHLMSVRKSERSFLGVVENPIRAEMELVARIAGAKYVFNCVLDRHGQFVKAFFGDMEKAFREGVKTCKSIYGVAVKRKTPIVLASSSPCDIEFWQAHKTLYPADMVVEEGGMIIIATPCPEGIAKTHPELLEFAGLDTEVIDSKIDSGEIKDVVAGSAGLQWSKMRQKAEICLVTDGITAEETQKIGFTHANTIMEAVERGYKKYGTSALMNIFMNGPDTLPILSPIK